jgi:hypothetical protein
MRTASPGASGTVQQSLDALARQAHGALARSVLVCSQRRRLSGSSVHPEYQIVADPNSFLPAGTVCSALVSSKVLENSSTVWRRAEGDER